MCPLADGALKTQTMKLERYLELASMTFGELMQPLVSLEEFDFMLANVGKTIDEIKFDEE